MAGAIEKYLPQTTHLLCQWHMMQNLKKNFIYLLKRQESTAKLLYRTIVYDLLFTDSPFRFQKLLEQLFECGKNVLGQ